MPSTGRCWYASCPYPGGVLHVEIRHCVKPTSPCFNVGKRLCLRRHLHFSNTTGEVFAFSRSRWGGRRRDQGRFQTVAQESASLQAFGLLYSSSKGLILRHG